MKILIDIGHPADVHQFKFLRSQLLKKGNNVLIVARDKDVTHTLLKNLSIPYVSRGKGYTSILGKAYGLIKITRFLKKEAITFQPDILIGGPGNVYISLVSKLTGIKSIIFDDTEHSSFELFFVKYFASCILTSTSYKKRIRKDQIRYGGFQELAYLNPNYFTIDYSVIKELEIVEDQKFVILRFVSWNALHDTNNKGIDYETKKKIIEYLSNYYRVFISAEGNIPSEFQKYVLKIAPDKVHSILALAQLYIGEGATMAVEAAVLGTPSIYVNSLELGYCNELENTYNLLYNFRDSNGVFEKAKELIETPNLKFDFQKRRQKMLTEKIDVTEFMVWFVENFPDSFTIMRNSTKYQQRYRFNNSMF